MIELHLGDCLEILPTLADDSVDAVITDPPYGVGIEYSKYQDTREQLALLIDLIFPHLERCSKRIAVFSGIRNIDLYPRYDWQYSWFNPAGTGVSEFGFTCHHPILFYGKDAYSGNGSRPDAFRQMKNEVNDNDHPCPKPTNVMRWATERFSLVGDTILDPFMGSGTTGVACVQTGRNFIGIEIDQGYFEIAEKRIAEAQLQMRMPI